MAAGRMIAKKICLNKHIDELSSDISRLAFTWTIPHLDKNGRIHGDPCVLKSLIFPRRTDIDPEMMREMINEWAKAELIQLFEIQGDIYIEFPRFRQNQPGLKLDREPETGIPSPSDGRQIAAIPPSDGRQSDGEVPSQIKLKQSKLNKIYHRRRTGGEVAAAGRQEKTPPAAADAACAEEPNIFPEAEETGLSVKNGSASPLYHTFWDPMIKANRDVFSDYAKEGTCTRHLVKVAEARARAAPGGPDAADIAKAVLAQFWKLKQGGDKFWSGQPFTPSGLSPLWDRVLETMRTDVISKDTLEVINRSRL